MNIWTGLNIKIGIVQKNMSDQAGILANFSQLLERFFLTLGQNNFVTKYVRGFHLKIFCGERI